MKRVHGTLTASLAALLLAGGLTVVTTGTALAAGCSASRCTELDPYTEKCPVTYSVTHTYASGAAVATLTNYYSSTCVANWLVASENSAAMAKGWALRLDISSYIDAANDTGLQEACTPGIVGGGGGDDGSQFEDCNGSTYNGSTGWPMWTDMVDGANTSYGTMDIYQGTSYVGSVHANQ
jgi:hypothetical protein